LDDLGWLRPQEISQPTIHGTGMNTKITSTYVHNLLVRNIVYTPHI